LCDPLWENKPDRQLFHDEIEVRKVDAVITAVGDQILKAFFLPYKLIFNKMEMGVVKINKHNETL